MSPSETRFIEMLSHLVKHVLALDGMDHVVVVLWM